MKITHWSWCCSGSIGLGVLLVLCLASRAEQAPSGFVDQEPVYAGRPLSEWAEVIQYPSEARGAAEAMRAIGPAKAIPFLLRWIQPPWKTSTTPGGVKDCFELFGPEAKAAIPGLAKILSRPAQGLDYMSAQAYAAEALSHLGPDAVPVLLAVATNFQGDHFQWQIIDNMAHFGTNGAAAKPALLEWSKSPDPWVRLGALHAYVAIEDNKSAAMDLLLEAVKDPCGLMRRDAAEALGWVAQGQTNVLPALLKALADPDWQVRAGAVTGLGKLGRPRTVVLPLLVRHLHDENWIIRRTAAFALGDLGGKEAFDELMKATDDPAGFVRETVFQSLKRIDANALARSGKKFSPSQTIGQ